MDMVVLAPSATAAQSSGLAYRPPRKYRYPMDMADLALSAIVAQAGGLL